jgi:hypothetical protein
MCKWHKYLGNGRERLKASVRRKLQPDERRAAYTGGSTTMGDVQRNGWKLR